MKGGDTMQKARWNAPQLIDLNLGKTEFVWNGNGHDGIWAQVVNPPNPIPEDVFGS